jgi:hypothetical protein
MTETRTSTSRPRGLKTMDFRRRRLLVQQAVDAVANPQTRGLRFEMHVARSQLNRFQQDFVHQADDGRLLGHVRQLGAIGLDFFQQLDAVVHRLGDQPVDGFAAHAKVGFDELADLRAAG